MGGWAAEGRAARPGPPARSSQHPPGDAAGSLAASGRRGEARVSAGQWPTQRELHLHARVSSGAEGGGGQGAAAGAGAASRAGQGTGTHLGGWRCRVPAPAAGGSARCPPAVRRADEAPRTDRQGGTAAARARRSRALSRRGSIAGRRCRRWRQAGGRAAGGAVRPGPGRTAGLLAAAIGPRCRSPPPPIGRGAAPLLRHRPAGGAPRGTRGKVGRNLRARGGRGRGSRKP